MTQVTEATFDDGVLRPDGPLSLRPKERVRIIVQSLEASSDAERAAAMARLRQGVKSMGFKSTNGRYPTRDELHERR